jgi:hypothetical protein
VYTYHENPLHLFYFFTDSRYLRRRINEGGDHLTLPIPVIIPTTCYPVEQIHELLKRRPCMVDDIVSATGIHTVEVIKILRVIAATTDLLTKREARGVFYYFRK